MIKSICLFFVLLVNVGLAQEQEELPNYASAAAELMSLYNSGDYQGIFDLFNDDMKKALPRENTIDFFNQNVNGLMGKMVEMKYATMKDGAHFYRTTFDRAIADIAISLSPSNQIMGLLITPVKPDDLPILERNTTKMILPFKETVFVFWGGITEEQNYHMADATQQYAYDILMVENGASYKGDALKNENYFIFGKDIIAPCNARVVKVITGVVDNVPGEMNPTQLTGNTVVLQASDQEFILFAHLKKGSILVEEGQDVLQGEVIGMCGNSGNSTEPHLHLGLQNDAEFLKSTGAKLFFDRLIVNGELKEDYLPVKEDFIKNIN